MRISGKLLIFTSHLLLKRGNAPASALYIFLHRVVTYSILHLIQNYFVLSYAEKNASVMLPKFLFNKKWTTKKEKHIYSKSKKICTEDTADYIYMSN